MGCGALSTPVPEGRHVLIAQEILECSDFLGCLTPEEGEE